MRIISSAFFLSALLACGTSEDGVTDASAPSGNDGSVAKDGGVVSPHDGAGVDGADAPGDSSVPNAEASVDAGCAAPATYDQRVLCDRPVAYWAMHSPPSEPDLTGNGNTGTYKGGTPGSSTLPNGDPVVVFDGATQFMTVPSRPSMSIPTTGDLAWEGWIRPDVLQFPHDDASSGYVDWLGKCDSYSPTCEWEARFYDTTTKEVPNRCNRFSAYAFNPTAGLGSGADWQPVCGSIAAKQWYHVVGQYTTRSQPADCPTVVAYPGSLDIWVNGVEWNQANHSPTGCMSQYKVAPVANGSAVNVGTMAGDAWFLGAIGKVAIYGRRLTGAEIAAHYTAMTGSKPKGTCGDTCSF